MKRLIAICLLLVTALSLFACGDKKKTVGDKVEDNNEVLSTSDFYGKWESAFILMGDESGISIEIDKSGVTLKAVGDEDEGFEAFNKLGKIKYTMTHDSHYLYIEPMFTPEQDRLLDDMGGGFVLVLIGTDTLAICEKLYDYDDNDDYLGYTPNGSAFYGECGLYFKEGSSVKQYPENIDSHYLNDATDNNPEKCTYRYYPDCSILFVTDEYGETNPFYVKLNGSMVYFEQVAVAHVGNYKKNDIFTDHNLVITDSK